MSLNPWISRAHSDGIYAGLDQLFPPTLQWGITGHVQGDASRPFVLVDPPHAVDARIPRAVTTVRSYRGFRDFICEHVVDIRVKYYDVFHTPTRLRISYVWRATRLWSPGQAPVLATGRQRNGLADALACQPHHDQALSSAADSSKVFLAYPSTDNRSSIVHCGLSVRPRESQIDGDLPRANLVNTYFQPAVTFDVQL